MSKCSKIELDIVTVVIPLPNKWENPNNNRGTGRRAAIAKTKVKQRSRENGRLCALVAKQVGQSRWAGAKYTPTFYHTTNRNRDQDNAIASLKATLDGIAEAWGMNDSTFRHSGTTEFKIDKLNPRVELRFERITQ